MALPMSMANNRKLWRRKTNNAVGIQVGSGNAAMAKVMVLGSLAATVSGGGLIGWVLAYGNHETKENQKEH